MARALSISLIICFQYFAASIIRTFHFSSPTFRFPIHNPSFSGFDGRIQVVVTLYKDKVKLKTKGSVILFMKELLTCYLLSSSIDILRYYLNFY
jgi:hypothetical protein